MPDLRHASGHLMIVPAVLFLFLSGAEGQSGPALASDSLHLEDVIKAVVEHNDFVAAARYMEKASNLKIGPSGAWDDPMIMAGVQNLPTSFDFRADEMTMKMIGISQSIPYAGQKGLLAKAARADAEASREGTRGTETNLVTAAKYAYYEFYYTQQILDYTNSQLQIQQDVVKSATAKLRSDQASQADVLTAQANLWRLESDVLNTQQAIEAAENNLLSLMGREPGEKLPPLAAPEARQIPAVAEEWFDKAKEHYPELKRLERQSRSYAFQAASAQRMRWPMLSVAGSYGFREDTPDMRRDDMISLQVNLSIPVFSGRQQGRMAQSMEAMRRGAEAEANQLWRDTKANLQTLHSRATRLRQSLDIYRERIIPADEEAYRSAYTGYSANRVPFINLLTYAMNIYRDRIDASQIEHELSRTLAEAEQYTTNPLTWTDR